MKVKILIVLTLEALIVLISTYCLLVITNKQYVLLLSSINTTKIIYIIKLII